MSSSNHGHSANKGDAVSGHQEVAGLRHDVEYVVGIHDFDGRTDDELTVKKGDYIEVVETDDAFGDGWYVGRNVRTHQAGLFPKNFTTGAIMPKSPTRQGSVRASSGSNRRMSRDQHLQEQQQQNRNSRDTSGPSVSHQAASLPSPQGAPSSEAYRTTVHDTLTDIDAAILEFNAPTPQQAATRSTTNTNQPLRNHNSSSQRWSASTKHTYVSGSSSADPSSNHSDARSPVTPSTINNNNNSPASTLKSPNMTLPQDGFDYSSIPDWSPAEVRRYLLALGYDHDVADCFAEHKIKGSIFLELDMASLREIGIVTFGTRFEISKEIKKLNSLVSSQRRESEDYHSPGMSHSTSQGQLLPAASITPRSASLQGNNLKSPGAHDRIASNNDGVEVQEQSYFPDTNNNPVVHERKSSFNRDWTHPMAMPNNGGLNDDSFSQQSTGSSYESLPSKQSYSKYAFPRADDSDHIRTASKDTVRGSKRSSMYDLSARQHTRSASSLGLDDGSRHVGSRDPGAKTVEKEHRRHSSIMSFLRTSDSLLNSPVDSTKDVSQAAGSKDKRNFLGLKSSSGKRINTVPNESSLNVAAAEKPRSVSTTATSAAPKKLTKQQTSAFTEGIRRTTAAEASKTATFAGWMHKKGSGTGMGTWKNRYFVLDRTRLSYFGSFDDDKEKGLIDITGHRVLPAKENEDKFVSLYAASMRAGRFCFKLVPPAPGFRKGITFTAPKVHYFAVDSKGEMRAWMAALMKATIDRDDTVPVESTFSSPTISLAKAQELFKEGRERDEDLRAKMVAEGLINQRNSGNRGSPLANSTHVFPISTPIAQSGSNSGQTRSSSGAARKPVGYPSTPTPDSPTGSSMESSRTGSSATNNSSVKATQSYSPADGYQNYGLRTGHHDDEQEATNQLHAKTANLKIVDEFSELN